jgi:hypothetical protein
MRTASRVGTFGGAVALGVAIVIFRRNAGWGLSQTIMQARVAAQGACLAGILGAGIYASRTSSDNNRK